ncbi:hypothetical protein, partial [Neorhizobium galegae]|uniref:hypothetical protein n=1 Tax=Neorhizobium galegae TaxID=399 RepID=UPI002102B15E
MSEFSRSMLDVKEFNGEETAASLCIDCARHTSLKKMIAADCTTGRCALCARARVDVRNPNKLAPLVMLIRALIRSNYHAPAYNQHWAGDSVLSLFSTPVKPHLAPQNTHHYLHLLYTSLPHP